MLAVQVKLPSEEVNCVISVGSNERLWSQSIQAAHWLPVNGLALGSYTVSVYVDPWKTAVDRAV